MAKKDNSWLVPLFESNDGLTEMWAVDETKQAFYLENDAITHAADWRAVEPRKVTRAEVEDSEAEATKVVDLAPSDKWTVAKLQEWLTAKEIAFDEKSTKAQLLALVPAE